MGFFHVLALALDPELKSGCKVKKKSLRQNEPPQLVKSKDTSDEASLHLPANYIHNLRQSIIELTIYKEYALRVECKISDPPVLAVSFEERWHGPDQGLVCCWLRGLEKAKKDPELAEKAKRGELPVLAWKGGVEKRLKSGVKVGSINYVATWYGLRGEDLCLEIDAEIEITCSRTGVKVTFTSSTERLVEAEEN